MGILVVPELQVGLCEWEDESSLRDEDPRRFVEHGSVLGVEVEEAALSEIGNKIDLMQLF